MNRFVDKTRGRENWVVRCSIDFMQKFGLNPVVKKKTIFHRYD